jgi:hypothetical protein
VIAAATRQDLQNALDRTRNTILGTMFSRSDARTVAAQLKSGISQDLHELQVLNHQILHQTQASNEHLTAKLNNLEQRLYSLQHLMTKFLETQAHYTNTYYK